MVQTQAHKAHINRISPTDVAVNPKPVNLYHVICYNQPASIGFFFFSVTKSLPHKLGDVLHAVVNHRSDPVVVDQRVRLPRVVMRLARVERPVAKVSVHVLEQAPHVLPVVDFTN